MLLFLWDLRILRCDRQPNFDKIYLLTRNWRQRNMRTSAFAISKQREAKKSLFRLQYIQSLLTLNKVKFKIWNVFDAPLFGWQWNKKRKKKRISAQLCVLKFRTDRWSWLNEKKHVPRTKIAFTLKLKTATDLKTRKGTYNWKCFWTKSLEMTAKLIDVQYFKYWQLTEL